MTSSKLTVLKNLAKRRQQPRDARGRWVKEGASPDHFDEVLNDSRFQYPYITKKANALKQSGHAMSEAEAVALAGYTGGEHDWMNPVLRGQRQGTKQDLQAIAAASSALAKLPVPDYPPDRPLHRFMRVHNVKTFDQDYPKLGETFTEPAFLSSSRGDPKQDLEHFIGLDTTNPANVFMKVRPRMDQSTKGRFVGEGGNEKETEILFPPGTRFKVVERDIKHARLAPDFDKHFDPDDEIDLDDYSHKTLTNLLGDRASDFIHTRHTPAEDVVTYRKHDPHYHDELLTDMDMNGEFDHLSQAETDAIVEAKFTPAILAKLSPERRSELELLLKNKKTAATKTHHITAQNVKNLTQHLSDQNHDLHRALTGTNLRRWVHKGDVTITLEEV